MMARRPQTPGGKRTSLARSAARKRAQPDTDDDEDEDSIEESSEDEELTDDGGGKQQVGAYEEAVIESEEEETSLTSPQTKITKNDYMAIHVRNTTTSKVFRAVKFLNTPTLIENTMTKLARVYDVQPHDYHTWRGLYQKEVVYAINNKRNSVYQDVKPKLQSTYEVRIVALFDISNQVLYILVLIQDNPTWTIADFTDVRSDYTNKKGFFAFFDIVVTGVCGRRSWTKAMKASQTITDSKKVTVSDEAYAELILKNYWDRIKTGGPAKWTDGRSGNLLQHGWSAGGHLAFNAIYSRIKVQRSTIKDRQAVESAFMKMAQDEHCGSRKKRKVGGELTVDEEVMVDDW
jgi:hypothetical protein